MTNSPAFLPLPALSPRRGPRQGRLCRSFTLDGVLGAVTLRQGEEAALVSGGRRTLFPPRGRGAGGACSFPPWTGGAGGTYLASAPRREPTVYGERPERPSGAQAQCNRARPFMAGARPADKLNGQRLQRLAEAEAHPGALCRGELEPLPSCNGGTGLGGPIAFIATIR